MGKELVQLTSVNHVTHLQVRHIHILFTICTNGRTGSRTNASCGRGTSVGTHGQGTSETNNC